MLKKTQVHYVQPIILEAPPELLDPLNDLPQSFDRERYSLQLVLLMLLQ